MEKIDVGSVCCNNCVKQSRLSCPLPSRLITLCSWSDYCNFCSDFLSNEQESLLETIAQKSGQNPCNTCSATVLDTDRYCHQCGASLGELRQLSARVPVNIIKGC